MGAITKKGLTAAKKYGIIKPSHNLKINVARFIRHKVRLFTHAQR